MIKKLNLKFLFSLLTLISIQAGAQTEEDAVKKPINNLFEGMRKGDTLLIRSAFSSSAIMQTVIRNKEGKVIVVSEPVDSFLVSIGKPHKEVYDERITFATI